MDKNKIKFIVTETNNLHDKVNQLYESLMDSDGDVVEILSSISESIRRIKKDFFN